MQLRGLHPALRPFAAAPLDWAARHGVRITVTSVYRPLDQQRSLRDRWERCVAQGRWRPDLPADQRPAQCRWPANRPGDSAHNYGLAWDSTIEPASLMPWWVAVRRAWGWVVPDHDAIHAEVPDWRRVVRAA
ncbi:MAG: M15 family metallopeptidase [Gammaproteobacteria bacterium]|nr:M15 family metallopeptidase [Gammaproteobacteria bacterium]